MAEKKHFGDCPECGAPCEVIETSYIEEGHEVHFVEHKYSHRGAGWVKAQFGNYDTYPVANKDVFIKYDEYGPQKEVGDLQKIIELVEDGCLNVEWYDESGTAPESPAEQPVDDSELKQEVDHLEKKISMYEEALEKLHAERYETRLALRMLLKVFKNDQISKDQEKYYSQAETILEKHGKVTDVLRTGAAEQPGREEMNIDELWDEHSELIDDDIDTLSRWAGSTVVDKEQFRTIVAQLWEVFKKEKVC